MGKNSGGMQSKRIHTSVFLSHWIQILANSSPKSDIKKKKKPKKKTDPVFSHFTVGRGEGQHKFFFFVGLINLTWKKSKCNFQVFCCKGVHTCIQTHYTGWPRKNATTLIVNFKNIVDETILVFIFHFVEHSFSNKMTPWSLILGKVSGS